MKTDTPTILIVDDLKENLTLLVEILTSEGYLVRPCLDPELAITGALAQPPDLILLDIMMPKIDGYTVCYKLKLESITKNIPIIFISALNEVFDKVKAFEVGGVDYITKPFQVEEVLARVKTHLSLSSLQKKLQQQNQQLNQTIEQLKATQSQLIESEKMAILGKLVASIAHEVNTPLGIGITVASTLATETEKFAIAIQQNNLKRSVLNAYVNTAQKSSKLLLNNLERAGELIQSFKQVAVDQTYWEKREFVIKDYLEELLISLSPKLDQDHHCVKILDSQNVSIISYPGALAQIATNLIINSLQHGYKNGESGNLCFKIYKQENSKDNIIIEYRDDGCGIADINLQQIFEPFFTTSRHQGGTGLGLYIVFNLVTQKLQGTIRCESHPSRGDLHSGTKFIINLPSSL